MTTKSTKLVEISDQVSNLTTTKKRPPRAGMGRPKGIPNKNTKAIKDMILGALDGAGGEAYLLSQAKENPTAFMSLLGKVLPTELKQQIDGGFMIKVVTGVPDPEA